MAEQQLQQQLQQLQQQLHQTQNLTEADRIALNQLLGEIKQRLADQSLSTPSHPRLVDQLSLVVEQTEVDHPNLTATLRGIIQTLMGMGI